MSFTVFNMLRFVSIPEGSNVNKENQLWETKNRPSPPTVAKCVILIDDKHLDNEIKWIIFLSWIEKL